MDFPYISTPIRKSVDRKKLLGHTCNFCINWYLDMPNYEKQTLLQKCSKHRSTNPPTLQRFAGTCRLNLTVPKTGPQIAPPPRESAFERRKRLGIEKIQEKIVKSRKQI